MMASETTAELLSHLLSRSCWLRLYTNAHQPTSGSRIADFVEMKAPGYEPQVISSADWTITAGAPSQATTKDRTFSFRAPAGVVAGYFITRGSALLWAERFTSRVELVNQGDTIDVAPTLTAS